MKIEIDNEKKDSSEYGDFPVSERRLSDSFASLRSSVSLGNRKNFVLVFDKVSYSVGVREPMSRRRKTKVILQNVSGEVVPGPFCRTTGDYVH